MAFLQNWGEGEWVGEGGGLKAQQYYATKQFHDLFGRAPTQSELDRFSAAYNSGDKNIANISGGNALIADYYDQQVNTPEKRYADEQAKYMEAAPQFYDQLNGQFQSVLGREATSEEKEHFGKLMASGQADAYTLGQFLKQLPENVRREDEQFRTSLRDQIKTEDSRYFSEQVMPGIQSSFAKAGRDVQSSGFANALAQAAQQQNTGREDFLSNLTANQYQGNKANAYNEYLNQVGRINANQDYSRTRRDQLADQTTGRLYDMQNFAMQKQAYDDYLSRYGKRSGGIGSMIGGAVGTGLGAYFGGPTGAMVGNSLGSGFGGYWQ